MLLVVRGDLQSETGWSRATRALVQSLSADFSAIAGVDLHYHQIRSTAHFPGAIISDAVVQQLMRSGVNNVVLHATLPDGIFRVPNAVNLGWWFWETDKLPVHGDWIERLGSLDHILVPSRWQAEIVSRLGLPIPVSVVPWPHTFAATEGATTANAGQLGSITACQAWSPTEAAAILDIDRRYHSLSRYLDGGATLVRSKIDCFNAKNVNLAAALNSYDGYYLALQSDAPRKGLAVLIHEWCRYRQRSHRNLALVVRFSSLDVGRDAPSILQRFSEIATIAAAQASGLEHVFAIVTPIRDDEIGNLYRSARALVAPTYGEGFGGTLVEAVQNNCLLIAPRHTACEQLIPPSYPGAYKSVPYVGALIGALSIQPANGTWHVPVPGEIAQRLLWADEISPPQRAEEIGRLRAHMAAALSPQAARVAVLAAADAVRQARASRPPPTPVMEPAHV